MKIWRRLIRNGGARLAKKADKAMPLVGTAVVAGYEIKKKGLVRGIVNTALDAPPALWLLTAPQRQSFIWLLQLEVLVFVELANIRPRDKA